MNGIFQLIKNSGRSTIIICKYDILISMLIFIAKKMVRGVEIIEKVLPKVHIYHIEDLFVLSVLIFFALLSGGNYIEWIGVIAAFLSFKHTVISFRLQEVLEKEEAKGETHFHEAGKQSKLFFSKESFWLLYFVLLGAWSGMVSVIIFMLYPFWHKVRLRYHRGTKHLNHKNHSIKNLK